MTPKKPKTKPIQAYVGGTFVELQKTPATGVEYPEGGPYMGQITTVTFPDGAERDEVRAYPWAPVDDEAAPGESRADSENPLGLPAWWTPDLVRQWLGDAMLTMRRLPAKGCWPAVHKSSWTEWLRDVWVAVDKDDQVVTQDRESARRQPTMLEIGRMDVALSWPFWISNVSRRKATVTVAMGFGLRTCGRIAGCSHRTAAAWAEHGFGEIADRLNDGRPPPIPALHFGGRA